MKVIKKGKLPEERCAAAVKKFTSRQVCENCKSTLEFNANDLQSYCVPGKVKIICPICNSIVEIDEGGLPFDIFQYFGMVRCGYWKPVYIEG